ncbi:MAG: LamG domain-containing protein [Deltaproteobacteria bacterium]|nr:LamG domain-containing protein [Deltaproteobacteria bacterium]
MRSSPVVALLCLPLACAQVLKLDDFGVGGAASGGQGGGAGTPAVGGSGGAGAMPSGGSGGVSQGGGGTGGAGCAESYLAAVEDDSPAAFIRLEEEQGPTVTDHFGLQGSAGDGVDFAVANLPPCAGSSAASFSGAGISEIDFGPVLGVAGNSSFSIEVWLRAEALDGMVIRKLSGTPHNGYTLAFSEGSLFFRRYHGNGANSIQMASSILGTNGVHHVVGTYDGQDTLLCAYVDGAALPCIQAPAAIEGTGGRFLVGTSGYKGVIDEVAVYPTALSTERVEAHYAAGQGLPFP